MNFATTAPMINITVPVAVNGNILINSPQYTGGHKGKVSLLKGDGGFREDRGALDLLHPPGAPAERDERRDRVEHHPRLSHSVSLHRGKDGGQRARGLLGQRFQRRKIGPSIGGRQEALDVRVVGGVAVVGGWGGRRGGVGRL